MPKSVNINLQPEWVVAIQVLLITGFFLVILAWSNIPWFIQPLFALLLMMWSLWLLWTVLLRYAANSCRQLTCIDGQQWCLSYVGTQVNAQLTHYYFLAPHILLLFFQPLFFNQKSLVLLVSHASCDEALWKQLRIQLYRT